MATNAITATARTFHKTLTANDVDVVTLPRSYNLVEVLNRDTSNDLWVTLDRGDANGTQTSTTPAVGGAGSFYVGPGGVRVLEDDPAGPASVVRVTSTAAVAYSISGQ